MWEELGNIFVSAVRRVLQQRGGGGGGGGGQLFDLWTGASLLTALSTRLWMKQKVSHSDFIQLSVLYEATTKRFFSDLPSQGANRRKGGYLLSSFTSMQTINNA